MAATLRFCEQVDLENAVGGARTLVQLLDKDEDGIADANLVEDVLEAGNSDMASRIERAVVLASLARPYPSQLIKQSARACAFYAWGQGSENQAMPPMAQKLYDNAIAWANEVGDRKQSLGSVPRAALDPPAQMIDPDPNGEGISIAGFKRGLR
jgi:hypothetical protein